MELILTRIISYCRFLFTNNISGFLLILFVFCNFSVFAQTELTFATVTECITYSGDKSSVKKITITGDISGADYSEDSEWSKFYDLNIVYPALESIEILTSQDIPAADVVGDATEIYALFFKYGGGIYIENIWLKSFSAPNVKKIGKEAFDACENLESVCFPNATEIGGWAFYNCYSLQAITPEMFPNALRIDSCAFWRCRMASVHFPKVEVVEAYAFWRCEELMTINFPKIREINFNAFQRALPIQRTEEGEVIPLVLSVSLGTELETPTKIMHDSLNCASNASGSEESIFDAGVAAFELKQVALTLGVNVLPKPVDGIWPPNDNGCPWGNIAIVDGIEEFIAKASISPNPVYANTLLTLELEADCDIHISLCDVLGAELMDIYKGRAEAGEFTKMLDTRKLASGVYFVKILVNDRYIVEKLVVRKD